VNPLCLCAFVADFKNIRSEKLTHYTNMNKLIILITILFIWNKYSRCETNNDFIKLKEENGIQLFSR